MIANSHGQSLDKHLKLVGRVGGVFTQVHSAARVKDWGLLSAKVVQAGHWHDVGKATTAFQEYIHLKLDPDNTQFGAESGRDDEFALPLHHEISWAIGSLPRFALPDPVLWAVYFHHARPIGKDRGENGYYADRASILAKLSRADIGLLEKILADIGIDGSGLLESVNTALDERQPHPVPELVSAHEVDRKHRQSNYMTEDNYIRAALIWSDRWVSRFSKKDFDAIFDTTDESLKQAVESEFTMKAVPDARFELQTATSRDQIQQELASKCFVSDITNLQLPAGFGKTRTALRWYAEHVKSAGKNRRQLVWVTPRNSIAVGVYENIVKDLESLGMRDTLTAELFYGGTRKAMTHDADVREEFGSDIVVTNIDNTLFPFVRNNVAIRAGGIGSAMLVFDEYHEFITKEALFAAFVSLMRMRARYFDSKTLLMSATPLPMAHFWDGLSSTGFITTLSVTPPESLWKEFLPFRRYRGRYSTGSAILPIENGIQIFNSVSNAQRSFNGSASESKILAHGKYTDEDKTSVLRCLLDGFGKAKAPDDVANKCVYSAHIVQAALDVSFYNMQESVVSPQFSLQRVGRLNRWGKQKTSNIHFVDYSADKGERMGAAIHFPNGQENNLKELWWILLTEFIRKYKSFELRSLYELYDRYFSENNDRVRAWLNKVLHESFENLSDITPVKRLSKPAKAGRGSMSGGLRGEDSYDALVREVDLDGNYLDSYVEITVDKRTADAIATAMIASGKTLSKDDKVDKLGYPRKISDWRVPRFLRAAKMGITPLFANREVMDGDSTPVYQKADKVGVGLGLVAGKIFKDIF